MQVIPVVFVGGILFGRDCARPLREAMQRELIGYSLPGFDNRPRLEQHTPTPYDYAEDLFAAETLPEQVHLAGLCSGTAIALAAAHRFPERVLSVSLMSYWPRAREWESRKEMEVVGVREYVRRRTHKLVHNPELRQRVEDDFCGAITDTEAVMQVGRMMVEHPVKAEFESLTHPLAMVIGLRDRVTSPAAQVNVAAKRGVRNLLALDDVGHLVQYERPAQISAFLEPFWTSCERV